MQVFLRVLALLQCLEFVVADDSCEVAQKVSKGIALMQVRNTERIISLAVPSKNGSNSTDENTSAGNASATGVNKSGGNGTAVNVSGSNATSGPSPANGTNSTVNGSGSNATSGPSPTNGTNSTVNISGSNGTNTSSTADNVTVNASGSNGTNTSSPADNVTVNASGSNGTNTTSPADNVTVNVSGSNGTNTSSPADNVTVNVSGSNGTNTSSPADKLTVNVSGSNGTTTSSPAGNNVTVNGSASSASTTPSPTGNNVTLNVSGSNGTTGPSSAGNNATSLQEIVYGNTRCPCVGLDQLSGKTTVIINGTTKVEYPADLGAHCEAWDDDTELLSCKPGETPGKGNSWCAQRWCFVDPCNCDIDVKPKTSSYLPDGTYQGKPIYYSYSTCGGTDTWNDEQEVKMAEVDEALCDAHNHDDTFGKDECKCIGISGEPGVTNVMINGKPVAFPADTGTMCKAWDLQNHPDCIKDSRTVPSWCAKSWCFVDPCSCSVAVPPKTSSYLPSASDHGHALYYSYDTCGSTDTWTAENHNASCVNMKSEAGCQGLSKCGWDAAQEICVGKELLEDCHVQSTTSTTASTTITTVNTTTTTTALSFGNPKCPCIGLDNITGETTVIILGRVQATYPADVGTHCAAWDDNTQPLSCVDDAEPGRGNSWCAQPWCFVDPCNCDIDRTPKASSYFPDSSYQGKPIFYSYSTCGGIDTWNDLQELKQEVNEKLCENREGEATWGQAECRCIGISGQPGLTNLTIAGEQVPYRTDTGSMCSAWDFDQHPDCTAGNASTLPDWCGKKWCYVDPCSCSLETPPKTSSYLPDALFQEHAVYYSYSTCGENDTWTEENHKEACVNQATEDECLAANATKCAWTGERCLGRELVEVCNNRSGFSQNETVAEVKSFATRRDTAWLPLSAMLMPVLLLLR